MTVEPVATGKSVTPEKAGVDAPTTLLESKSMGQYTLAAYESTDAQCPVCGTQFKSNKGFAPHFRAKHADKSPVLERVKRDFAVRPERALRSLHHGAGLSVREISEGFGYPRDGLADVFDKLGIETQDWTIGDWYDEEPEVAREHAQEVAKLGAPAREENGMAGKTGQDNPNWRGGKSVYDAVKKQLRPSFYTVRDDARADECYRCGASDCKLDVHHIVPIMAGGTNGDWNLMTLCESCHRTAEAYTRTLPGMGAVLTE